MADRIPGDWKIVRWKTYGCKKELKAIGARWDPDLKLWWVAPEKVGEAKEIVEEHRRG